MSKKCWPRFRVRNSTYICHYIFRSYLVFEKVFDGHRTDMILLTHYFCDFNRLLLLLNHTLLREVFFCQNLTFIWLTLKAVYSRVKNKLLPRI
jgi:hypothetical protein